MTNDIFDLAECVQNELASKGYSCNLSDALLIFEFMKSEERIKIMYSPDIKFSKISQEIIRNAVSRVILMNKGGLSAIPITKINQLEGV